MKKKTQGYAVIEFNHGGIPDNELKPEEFNQLQVSVLNALPADRKQPILRGCLQQWSILPRVKRSLRST